MSCQAALSFSFRFQKKARRKEKMFELKESYCPTCGKEFYPTPEWAYKSHGKLYCSWKCLQVKHKEEEAKRRAVKAKQLNRSYKKIQQVTANGTVVAVYESALVAADAVDGVYSSIYDAARTGKKYKRYYWRYQDENAMPKVYTRWPGESCQDC